MPRLLYFCERAGIHDRRIVAKFAEAGWEVGVLSLTGAAEAPPGALHAESLGIGADEWFPQEARVVEALRQAAARFRPGLTLAGPLHTAGFLAARAREPGHPLALVSMAYDILWNAARDVDDRGRVGTALAHCDLLLTDCSAVLRRCGELGTRAENICIPFGIDIGTIPPRPTEAFTDRKTFTVLSLRNWEPVHGIDTVLEAFAAARTEEPRLRLVLAGDGSLRDRIEAEIVRHGLAPDVTRAGRYDSAGLNGLLRSADLYLSCARVDGASISLLEAMAASLPVLVSAIDPNREWIAEEENGWLAPPGDPASFAAGIVRAARLPALRRGAIGARNRAVVEARADWSRNFPLLEQACRRWAG